MFLALKNGLGRLAVFFRGLLDEYGGAAAAYSLRRLFSGYSGPIVKVRRDADNAEKDFTSTTSIADWVNGKQETTLPADVATASAAFSLRKVKAAYSGDAVRIRRESDDVEVNVAFDANDEVSTSSAITNLTESPDAGDTTATTLGAFLTEDISEYQNDSSWTGWNAFGNAAASTSGGAITITGATASGSDGVRYNTFLPSVGNRYRYEFTVSSLALDGATSFQLKGNASNVIFSITATGSYSVEATVDLGGWGSFINFVLDGTASTGASITVDNLTITNIGHLATVHTWYDQAGSNDATQGTAGNQPLLAEAGSLLTSENGKVAIEFRRVDSSNGPSLLASSVSGLEGSLSFFVLGSRDATGNIISLSNSTSGANYFTAQMGVSVFNVNSRNTTSVTASATAAGAERIGFGVTTGQTSTKSGVDGGALVENTSDYGDDFGAGDLDQILIGALRTVAAGGHFDGHIQEFITYTSDQSSNRFKIESNINNHYDNSDSDDTRDGFVNTWYDQSGNGRDATAPADENEPKIVNAGSFITDGIDFTGGSTAHHFDTTHVIGATTTIFGVVNSDTISDFFLDMRDGASDGAFIFSATGTVTNDTFRLQYNAVSLTGSSGATGEKLGSFLIKDGSQKIRVNGTEVASGTTAGAISVTANTKIGTRSFAAPTSNWSGHMKEIVIYNSDESANFSDIESNIAEEYGITLP